MFDPPPPPAVIPSQFFREFELPRLKRLFAAFKSAGALPGWLRIAGPAETIYPFYPEAGSGSVDPLRTQQFLPATCLDGNLKETALFRRSNGRARRVSQAFGDVRARSSFILSSGCEIPPESKPGHCEVMAWEKSP